MGAYSVGKYIMGRRPLKNTWRFGVITGILKNRNWFYIKWLTEKGITQSISFRRNIRPATDKEIIEAGISQL
jgi:hypothetical protein